jgi:hypothetical protein
MIVHTLQGTSKNLIGRKLILHRREPLKTSLRWFLEFPTLFFYLKEGILSMSYMLFFATPSFRIPSPLGF